MKLKRKQKAAQGLQAVTVPQAGSTGDIATSALSMASTGMAVAGPVGAGVGAVLGGVLGVVQKNKLDKANRQARKKNEYLAASRAYDGTDSTLDQGVQQFAAGGEPATKPIEVEKDELIFRKVGGRFRLKADFTGGKPHSQGGEPYHAQEGDIIFPGKQRKQVLTHLKNGNHTALEGMRLKLPKDTNPQGEAANGIGSVEPLPYRKGFPDVPAYLQPFLPVGETQLGLGEQEAASGFLADGKMRTRLPAYDYAQDIPAAAATSPEAVSKASGSLPELGNALQYASLANNLIQGLSPAEKVEENYVQPELLQYTDRSHSLRNQTLQARNRKASSARNSSGGNVQVQRALEAAADTERLDQLIQIDTQEQARASEVRATNAQLKGRAAEVNAQKRDQYAALNAQAQANKQAYLDYATGQLSSLGAVKEQQKYQKSRDAKADAVDQQRLGLVNQQFQFAYRPDGTINYTGGTAPYLSQQRTVQQEKVNYDNLGRVKGSSRMRRKPGL